MKPTAANASYMGGLTTANVRNGGAIFDTAGQTITIGQALVHSVIGGDNATDGGLVKLGTGTLTLSGTNTYTGSTTISNGALKINVPALADTANVIIASTGTLELNFVGTDIVNGLVINGVVKSPGTYGATGSGAANIDDAHFAGPGVLQVGTAPSPASIVPNRNGDQLILTWPTGAGWRLQKQTNSTAIGLRTNWLDVVGATPPYTNSVSAVDPTVFFRLAYP